VVALVFQLADSSLNYLYNAVFHMLVTYMYICIYSLYAVLPRNRFTTECALEG